MEVTFLNNRSFNTKMTLEQAVKAEIGRWDITLRSDGREMSYEQFVRPALYGIAIAIAEDMRENFVGGNEKYLNLEYHDAVKQFREEYLFSQLESHQFKVKETALHILASPNPENARTALHSRVKEIFGVTVKELRERKCGDYSSLPELLITEESIERAEVKIKGYADLFRASLLRTLMESKSKEIAQRIYELARDEVAEEGFLELNEIFEDKYVEAVSRFREWYINQQIKRSKDGAEAAKKCGLTDGAFRQWVFRHSRTMADFQQ